jgi:ribokinase
VAAPAYDVVVGTGGIGSGMFLALHGNRTLGREESRAATLLDQRDYCKLHIVCHYVRRLLGAAVRVVPVGKVGDDAPGRDALAAMRAEGLDVSLVAMAPRPTLFSVCFLYPNGDGGNITATGSASDCVEPADVQRAAPILDAHRGRAIALALPEVPVATRAALLDVATAAGALRVATFVSQEWEQVLRDGLLERVDLLAVNLDEAAALVESAASADGTADIAATAGGAADDVETGGRGASGGGTGVSAPGAVVEAAAHRLAALNPRMSLVVTAGRQGSWAWDGRNLTHTAALPVESVVGTAGAGDAHLAGLVVATAHGVPLAAANRYATAVSGTAVRSRHTIDPDLTADRVRDAARSAGWELSPGL